MASWTLIPCLVQLRAEFNRIAPARATGADGSVGDLAHQERTSDHNPDETGSVPIHDADHVNEVHALDITTALNESDLTLEKVVQFALGRCRSGAEERLRYIIFNRRIWEADNDWKQRAYTLADPHTGHAHFSASYTTSLEASTASWHLEDIPVAMTPADKTWMTQQIDDKVGAAADRVIAAIEKRVGDIVAYPDADPKNPTVAPATALGWLLSGMADVKTAVTPAKKP